MNPRRSLPSLCLPMLLAACQEPAAGPEDLGAAADMAAARCVGDALPLQNPRALALGETYLLPPPRAEAGCPADLQWDVAAAPPGSKNRVHTEGGAYPRFTPDVAGDYRLQLRGTAEQVALRAALVPTAERFRNHHLPPQAGLAMVGADLWSANGMAYTLTQLRAGQDGAFARVREVPVGAWPSAVAGRPELPYLLVAQRGADSVGFVDRERGVLEDALPVGDEPTALALAPDGKRLYVSLPTQREVAVVDVARREIAARIKVGFDPRALALSPGGERLFVASYRSGNLQDGPGQMRKPEDDQDVWIVNTGTLAIERTVLSVAADLRALALAPAGDELFVAATDGDTVVSQADPMAKPFVHLAAVLGASGDGLGKILRSADLTRQPSAAGKPFVNPAGVLASADTVWLSAESSSEVVALDRATLSERWRAAVCAGPRHLVALDDKGRVAVHCARGLKAAILTAEGKVQQTVELSADPRPAALALGEEVFYRPGGAYATNHSCTSCHVEAQNDGMVWNFGPRVYHNVRPLQLLDATTPIEWGAYVSSTANFGYQGPGSIVARPATQAEAEGLASFLGSLLGAPRQNGWTLPDGSYSEQGRRGKALFQRLPCAGCHTPGLYTSRRTIPMGKSGEPADVPTLLGVYRHGVYMVKGQSRSLEAALDLAIAYAKVDLSAGDRADLLRFLQELTPKGAAPLGRWPDIDSAEAAGADVQPLVRFSEPVDDTRGEAAAAVAARYLVLEREGGEAIKGRVEVQGGTLRFVPAAPLSEGVRHALRVLPGLPFRDGAVLDDELRGDFTVAKAAMGALPQAMRLTVYIAMGPGMPVPVPFDVDLIGRDNGAFALRYTLGPGQTQRLWAQLSGGDFYLQGFALPVGPRGVADAGVIKGAVKQVDDKGTITLIEGTLRIGAPGTNIPGVRFTLAPR